MSTNSIAGYSLDDYFQTTPIGSVNKAIGNDIYGINHRQIQGKTSINKDMYGLTFFVRPQLNLQSNNIRNLRSLYSLLSETPMSVQRSVRATLDPRLVSGITIGNTTIPPIQSPLTDNLSAFIPILTNNLISISGWPDIIAPIHTSKPGLYNEVYAQIDGISKNYEELELQATFRNTRCHSILYLLYVWITYGTNVFEGTLIPYLDFITENEIDYNTRIYRLVLDQNKTYVRKIACTGVSIPISVPIGSYFDYNNDKPYNDQNKDIACRFTSLGVCYNDDIVIKEFNATVVIFNVAMSETNRPMYMTKIAANLLGLFNNRGYPRINPTTFELEWWVSNQVYGSRTSSFSRIAVAGTAVQSTSKQNTDKLQGE